MKDKTFKNSKKDIAWGDYYFMNHVMPPEFNYKAHKKELSPFYESIGFKVSMMYADFYSQLNGIYSDKYIPMDLYYFYILPALNRFDFRGAYTDKNMYVTLFRGVRQPTTVIKNMNGIYYIGDEEIVPKSVAIDHASRETSDCIIKPTVNTCNGMGISMLQNKTGGVKEQIEKYAKNFIVQRKVKQHSQMCRLNESSLNTLRVHTYRDLNGRIYYLKGKTFLRFGGEGTVRDNVSSGGGCCVVRDDGSVCDSVYHFKQMNIDSLVSKGISDFKVPNYDKVINLVEKLHAHLPYFDFIGWDIAIEMDGLPLFIEFNVEPDVEIPQMLAGVFFGEFFDEVISRIKDVKCTRANCYRYEFSNGFAYDLIGMKN